MMPKILGLTFDLMEEYAPVWKGTKKSESIPTFGFSYAVGLEPIHVNLDGMIEKFKLGVQALSVLYESILPAELLQLLRTAAKESKDSFALPDEAWVKIIYHFALACHQKTMSEEHILKSLTPLYLGKVASFVIETWESTAEEVEQRLEELCITYEREKAYLNERWKRKT
jgi:hypothetical protein